MRHASATASSAVPRPETAQDRLLAFQSFNWAAAFTALAHPPAGSAALDAKSITLTPRQMEAVTAALTHRVAVLTGGPGTGKTTTVPTCGSGTGWCDINGGMVAV